MITKKLNHTSGKLSITIPSTLEEVPLRMLIALRDDLIDIEVINVLSGLPMETLYGVLSLDEFDIFREHVLSLTHQLNYVYGQEKIPKTVILNGKEVQVANSLSVEPVGAFMECRDLIADEINTAISKFGEDNWRENFKPDLNNAALILCHYFYCRYSGLDYNAFKAEELKEYVLDLPITQALPIARSFFLNYPNLLRQKVSIWQAVQQLWKKKQVLRRLKNLATTTR